MEINQRHAHKLTMGVYNNKEGGRKEGLSYFNYTIDTDIQPLIVTGFVFCFVILGFMKQLFLFLIL